MKSVEKFLHVTLECFSINGSRRRRRRSRMRGDRISEQGKARGRKKEVIGKICPCFLHLKSHIINRSGGRIQSKSSAQTFDKKIQSHDADIIISL